MSGKQTNIYVSVHEGIRNLIGRFSFHAGAMGWNDSEAVSKLKEKSQKRGAPGVFQRADGSHP